MQALFRALAIKKVPKAGGALGGMVRQTVRSPILFSNLGLPWRNSNSARGAAMLFTFATKIIHLDSIDDKRDIVHPSGSTPFSC